MISGGGLQYILKWLLYFVKLSDLFFDNVGGVLNNSMVVQSNSDLLFLVKHFSHSLDE